MPKLACYRMANTKYYEYYNCNPKNRITGDCVVRALSSFLNVEYGLVYSGLYKKSLETGYMVNDKKCYEKYLSDLGFKKMNQPRKSDNTKYTGRDFIDAVKNSKYKNCRFLCRIGGHHLTCISGCKFLDIWNPSDKCVNNYWVYSEKFVYE